MCGVLSGGTQKVGAYEALNRSCFEFAIRLGNCMYGASLLDDFLKPECSAKIQTFLLI